MTRQKQRRGPDQLALLVNINGVQRIGKRGGTAATHLDKCQALVVEHDEIDFAAAAAKVPRYGLQATRPEVAEGMPFRTPA